MRALLAAAFNYRKPLAPIGRGRHWRNRLTCQRSVDKIANSPNAISNAKRDCGRAFQAWWIIAANSSTVFVCLTGFAGTGCSAT
jgi:hypothetical protein